MLAMVDTTGLHHLVYVDGRQTAEKQWATIAQTIAKETRHRAQPVAVKGAYILTDNPNRRPYYTPGQKLRG